MAYGAWVLDGMVVCNAALPLRVGQCQCSYDRLCRFYSLYDNYSIRCS